VGCREAHTTAGEIDSPLGRPRYFTTMTTLGAAQDVTLQELRIEGCHPADSETRASDPARSRES
jgi:hypothetical protein